MFNFTQLKIKRETRKLESERISLEEAFKRDLNNSAQIYSSPVFDLISLYFFDKIVQNQVLVERYNPHKEAHKIAELFAENKMMRAFLNDMEYAKQSAKEIVG